MPRACRCGWDALAFPEERNGSHLEADVQTDFSGFPEPVAGHS